VSDQQENRRRDVRVFDSTDILTRDELTAIRKNYKQDETALQNLALRATASLYSEGRAFVTSVGDLLYGQQQPTTFVDPIDREIQLLTLFTITRQWSQLAVHCYWSLLLEMTPDDLARTLFLASMSAGISEYVSALGTMTKTMQMLKRLAPTEPTPEDVLSELEKAF
jgi:hypothetical protein